VIIAVCLLGGVALRLGTGRGFRSLATVKLRGEIPLMALLLAQIAVPMLGLAGSSARIAYYVWLATFPVMASIAWLNRKSPGMPILGAGLLLNFLVIAVNGGMPVFTEAASMVRAGALSAAIPASDFVHVLGTALTRAPWLADVVPLPGPPWLRAVASPGDLLLFSGIVAFLGGAHEIRE
jgi:hypothetical protein